MKKKLTLSKKNTKRGLRHQGCALRDAFDLGALAGAQIYAATFGGGIAAPPPGLWRLGCLGGWGGGSGWKLGVNHGKNVAKLGDFRWVDLISIDFSGWNGWRLRIFLWIWTSTSGRCLWTKWILRLTGGCNWFCATDFVQHLFDWLDWLQTIDFGLFHLQISPNFRIPKIKVNTTCWPLCTHQQLIKPS